MGRASHRRTRALTKAIARVAQVLAIVLCVAAVADFAYSAYQASDCFTDNADPLAQDPGLGRRSILTNVVLRSFAAMCISEATG